MQSGQGTSTAIAGGREPGGRLFVASAGAITGCEGRGSPSHRCGPSADIVLEGSPMYKLLLIKTQRHCQEPKRDPGPQLRRNHEHLSPKLSSVLREHHLH